VPLAFDAGTLSGTTDANGQVTFTDLVINTVGTGFEATFASGSILPIVEVFNVGPGSFDRYVIAYTDNNGVDEEDAVFPTVFQSTEGITGDADPDATGIQPAFIAIRGVDQFDNEVDLSVLPTEVYIDVVLLQNGTPVAGNPIIGFDNNGDIENDPYQELDLTVPVNPFQIRFPTAGGNPGTFVFSGDDAAPDTVPIMDLNTEGAQFRVEQAGSNYQLQISIGDTIADLDSAPDVLLTPEFSIEPTVGSLNIVENIGSPTPAGVELSGVVSGQAIQVEVLDTTGALMPNQTVAAVLASCPDPRGTGTTGAAGAYTDNTDPDDVSVVQHYLPVPDGDLIFAGAVGGAATGYAGAAPADGVYCTFADGPQRGGQFLANDGAAGTGVDPDEEGVRIITATTNALGVATFSEANGNALTVSEPDAANYSVAFTAGFDADGLNGVTAFTNEFGAIASELASLEIPAGEQAFQVVAAGNLQNNGGGDIRVNPLDQFGNLLDVVTPITVSVANAAGSANQVYGVVGGNLENSAASRTEQDASANGTPGAGNAGNTGVVFPNANYFVAATGADGAATATAAQPAGANAATGNSIRVRFDVVGTAISVTSNTFDPTP
ncbi:MAG: hypothetical protein AAF267_22760, partial [Deinococcota bacterium]